MGLTVVTPEGKIVWSLDQKELPGITLAWVTTLRADVAKRWQSAEQMATNQTSALTVEHVGPGYQPGIQAWYSKVFGALPGKRYHYEADDLPGVNLNFSGVPTKMEPTKGRMLDHIGFEVKGLAAFCKRLEAQGVALDEPYHPVPGTGLKSAFITDPVGTRIELTEKLAPAAN
jgi:catechol 2,3-dioxygenase-like lactoylglutathione lyase family enzyme